MSLSFDIDLPPTKEGDQIKNLEPIGLYHWEEVAKYPIKI